MATKIAVNHRVAASIMFDAGMGENFIINALHEIKQPTAGYYYPDDVRAYVNAQKVS